jgi:hypothetical protein
LDKGEDRRPKGEVRRQKSEVRKLPALVPADRNLGQSLSVLEPQNIEQGMSNVEVRPRDDVAS